MVEISPQFSARAANLKTVLLIEKSADDFVSGTMLNFIFKIMITLLMTFVSRIYFLLIKICKIFPGMLVMVVQSNYFELC